MCSSPHLKKTRKQPFQHIVGFSRNKDLDMRHDEMRRAHTLIDENTCSIAVRALSMLEIGVVGC